MRLLPLFEYPGFTPARMLKFISLMVTCVLLNSGAQAQSSEWSTPQKITNKTYYTDILGQNYAGIYYYQTSKTDRKRNILVTALRHDMRTKARDEFLTNSRQELVQLMLLNGALVMLYEERDRRENTVDLFVKILGPDLDERIQDKRISRIRTADIRSTYFEAYPSRDREKILLLKRRNPDEPNNNLSLYMLDNKGSFIDSSELIIESKLFENYELSRELFIDDHFFSILTYTEKEGLFKREDKKMLVSLDVRSNKMQLIPLYTDSVKTRIGNIEYDNKRESLLFNSLYYTKDSLKPEGFYQMEFSTKTNSLENKLIEFPQIYRDEMYGRGSKPSKRGNIYLMKTVRRSDGGNIFITERKEVDEQQMEDISVYGVQHSYVRYYYYFYEISILSLNPDGSVDWHKVIKKEQVSLNDDGYYSSFGCLVTSKRMLFVYNDLTRKYSNVMLYSVKPNGSGGGDLFIKGKDFDGYAIPKESYQISSNEILIPVVKVREGFTLLKLTL